MRKFMRTPNLLQARVSIHAGNHFTQDRRAANNAMENGIHLMAAKALCHKEYFRFVMIEASDLCGKKYSNTAQ